MAIYNNGFPMNYNGIINSQPNYNYAQTYPQSYQQNYPQNYNQQYNQQYVQPAQNQSSNGFIRVQSENEARTYPVEPGKSVSFINENLPYIYTKTVDTSQLDRPKFEKYKLVKEDSEIKEEENNSQPIDLTIYALKEDVDKELEELKEKIKEINNQLSKKDNNNRR